MACRAAWMGEKPEIFVLRGALEMDGARWLEMNSTTKIMKARRKSCRAGKDLDFTLDAVSANFEPEGLYRLEITV